MIELGLDPALGGGCAQVVAHLGDKLTVLDARTDYGLQRTEEILGLVEGFVILYKPSVVTIEIDSQQKGLGNDDRLRELGRRYGFQIRPHKTQGQKLDEVFGVASMDQSFRRGEIRIPYGDASTRDKMEPFLVQLRAWRPDIKTKNLTQDLVMALWFVWKHWQTIRKAQHAPPAPAWRPAWMLENARVG